MGSLQWASSVIMRFFSFETVWIFNRALILKSWVEPVGRLSTQIWSVVYRFIPKYKSFNLGNTFCIVYNTLYGNADHIIIFIDFIDQSILYGHIITYVNTKTLTSLAPLSLLFQCKESAFRVKVFLPTNIRK